MDLKLVTCLFSGSPLTLLKLYYKRQNVHCEWSAHWILKKAFLAHFKVSVQHTPEQ
jgi:hypothetical protein